MELTYRFSKTGKETNRNVIRQKFMDESIRMGEQDKELFYNFIDKEIGDKDLYLAGHIHAYAEDIRNHILVADKLFDKSRVEIHGYIIQDLIKGRDADDTIYHSERFCEKLV